MLLKDKDFEFLGDDDPTDFRGLGSIASAAIFVLHIGVLTKWTSARYQGDGAPVCLLESKISIQIEGMDSTQRGRRAAAAVSRLAEGKLWRRK